MPLLSRPAGAVRLYESVGFTTYGREPGGMRIADVLHDERHMSLRLSHACPWRGKMSGPPRNQK